MVKHKHHIIPRHMGGSDDPSNLVELTIEEHSDAHRVLFERYGRWQDEIAWKTLSGQISRADAIKMAQSFGSKNKIVSKETRERIRKSRLGRKDSEETRNIKKARSGVVGKKYYNDGVNEARYFVDKQPSGWSVGRLSGRVPDPGKGLVWYNDGKNMKRFSPSDKPPRKWKKGILIERINTERDECGRFTKTNKEEKRNVE